MEIKDLYELYLQCDCKVTTDSRNIQGGEIFFALKGENFDGNQYALSALEKGARWAVVDCGNLPKRAELIVVEDSFKALQQLAIHHRKHVRDGKLPVIGLTGTNGKTTTKNLIEAVLSCKYKVTATKGNLNNDIGVPLSLLSITPDTEIAVIEMGANHPDDITKLVQVSQPDYGLITNVGKAHLLGFGSFEGVMAAKGELYRWLGEHRGSLIFVNEDDCNLREMASKQPSHSYGYGMKYQGAELLPSSPDQPFLRIKLAGETINTQLVGSYNADNVLAALAVGEYFGVARNKAIEAIEGYCPANKRSQMMRTEKNTLIVDAYNANPSSMNAALDNFSNVQAERKIAMLGDMRELGEDSLGEHISILGKLRSMELESYLVGEEFAKAVEQEGKGSEMLFSTSEALTAFLTEHPVEQAVILLKGSRGIAMEKVMPVL